MKRTLHHLNLFAAIATGTLLFVFIGFYILPFFGIFQLIIMAISLFYYKQFQENQRKMLRIYWTMIGIFTVIAGLQALLASEFRSMDPLYYFFIGLYGIIAIINTLICIRFTKSLVKQEMKSLPNRETLDGFVMNEIDSKQ